MEFLLPTHSSLVPESFHQLTISTLCRGKRNLGFRFTSPGDIPSQLSLNTTFFSRFYLEVLPLDFLYSRAFAFFSNASLDNHFYFQVKLESSLYTLQIL